MPQEEFPIQALAATVCYLEREIAERTKEAEVAAADVAARGVANPIKKY